MLASEHPDRVAIWFAPERRAEVTITWGELERASNRAARLMQSRGVDETSMVVVGLPNEPEHYYATIGAWKIGACVLPISGRLPKPEREAILEAAAPAVVVSDDSSMTTWPNLTSDEIRVAPFSDAPMDDRVAHPGKAMGSGGSTGRPKIIINPSPLAGVPGEINVDDVYYMGMKSGQIQIVAGPLYHNSPFGWSHRGLFEDHQLVLMERFDALRWVQLVEQHHADFSFLVPTMMRRIVQLPDISNWNLSSLEAIYHTAAPCPAWVKHAWISLIGPEKVYEAYGATEAIGCCGIRGDEWLQHIGSVGRPLDCTIKIIDPDGDVLPAGDVGVIYMKLLQDMETYRYIGSAPLPTTADGYKTVGDMGWVDKEGYVYLADRRVDLIISGGENIYPAEVESVLLEHPAVSDVAVIGVPDADWGTRVHAVIQLIDPTARPTEAELLVHCRARIASYKVPKSIEFIDHLPRDESGKIRRSSLVGERSSGVSSPVNPRDV